MDEHEHHSIPQSTGSDNADPEAETLRQEFISKIRNTVKNKNKTRLYILIWGPGFHSENPALNKRKKIYDTLKAEKHLPFYSEEFYDPDDEWSLEFLEYIQASANDVHLIVLLANKSALGALGELHTYGTDPDIVSKMFVIVPEAFRKSFSGKGALWILDHGYGGVYWCEEAELSSSEDDTILMNKVLWRAQARREIEFKRRMRTEDSGETKGSMA